MQRKIRLRTLTFLYWFLLVYILAALSFWYIELEGQNRQMFQYRKQELKLDDPRFESRLAAIEEDRRRKTMQFAGEGAVFLAVILVGAVFMYRAVRRQLSLQKQQENFMMAITHELKTPIAIASLNLETLQKRKLEESKQQHLIGMTLQEINRLNTLATNILATAQLEEHKPAVREELDLSGLVRSTVDEYRERYPRYHWESSVATPIETTGDPLLLQILLSNLLENAVKYSPPGTRIRCSLEEADDHILLAVEDEGPGIPESERKHVWEKFYRIGNEVTRATKGTGLGLYLCKRIADAHQAVIRLGSQKPHGTLVTVRFEKKSGRR